MMKENSNIVMCCCIALLTGLAACSSGGMSEAEVQTSLRAFFVEVDQAYSDAGSPPLDQPEADMLKWTVDLESAMLQIVDQYVSANPYPAEIKQHMQDMRDGLSARISVFEAWIKNSTVRDSAPANDVKTADDAAMQSTSAETQLRIAADI